MAKQRSAARSAEANGSHSRIQVKLHRNVSLLKTTDSHVAEELLARKKLAGMLAGRLTDHVLLVRPGQEAALVEELRKIGHSPQVIRGASGG